MGFASFNDGNDGLQVGHNTGSVIADLRSSLEIGDITSTGGGGSFGGTWNATRDVNISHTHITSTPHGLAGYRRTRADSPEETSSCPDEHRNKRARQDDDNSSFSSDGSDFWREVDRLHESSRNAPPSQLTWNTEDSEYESLLDTFANGRSQGDNAVYCSEASSENEGVELTDNDSDSLEDEQLSVSVNSSEDSE